MQRFYYWLLIFCVIMIGCSCTKVKDLFIQPTPREVYKRAFKEDVSRYEAWRLAFQESLADSLVIQLPYQETGYFYPERIAVYSFDVELEQGEIFNIEAFTDSAKVLIFVDFFRKKRDSLTSYEFVKRSDPTDNNFQFEVKASGTYKIIIQPELTAQTPFVLTAYKLPSYGFPLAGKGNSDIRSYWGASRDGGSRSHEGIDIFAPRGNPVLSATDGRVRYAGERGLGGKQVWVRTGLFGNSLYYAHLDSIAVQDIKSVSRGDTLGFVGNTGNARTTSPHLHFGIYTGRGAVNPLPFVFKSEAPELPSSTKEWKTREVVVQSAVANLRNSASINGEKIGEAQRGDTLKLLGHVNNWKHIETESNLKAFIHQNLVD